MKKFTHDINYKFSDKTNVSVSFEVFGENYDTNEFSEIMDIEPSGIRGKKKKSPTNMENPYITWFISTGYEDSLDVAEQINKIMDILFEKKDILIKVKEEYSLNYMFELVIRIEKGYSPGLVLEKDFIDFMSSIGADMDVDIYTYSID